MTDKKVNRPPRRGKAPEPAAPLWVVALFVAALIGLMVWMTDRFVEYDKLQRCVTAGRRDCAPPAELPK